MKLNSNFIIYNTGKETMLVPTAAAPFHGLLQGNPTMEFILDRLRTDTTEEEIVAAMSENFKGDAGEMREDVSTAIAALRKIGAIED